MAEPSSDPASLVDRIGATVVGRRREIELVVAALTEPFNVVVLGALLVAGALLDTVALMVPLALVVYALSVWRSLRDPDTVRRLQGGRSRKSLRDG